MSMVYMNFTWFLLILKDFQCCLVIFIAFYSTSPNSSLQNKHGLKFLWSLHLQHKKHMATYLCCSFKQLKWISVIFNKFKWNSLIFNDSYWFILIFSGFQWISIDVNDFQWNSMIYDFLMFFIIVSLDFNDFQ